MNIFMFCVGVAWICMGIIGLFGRQISWLRRAIFLLMSGFYSAVGFAGAFHTDLGTVTGIGPSAVFMVMLLLPSIIILLGIRDGYHKRKQGPKA